MVIREYVECENTILVDATCVWPWQKLWWIMLGRIHYTDPYQLKEYIRL